MRIDKAGMAAPQRGSTRARRLQPGFALPPDEGVCTAASPEPAQAASEAAPASLLSLSTPPPATDQAANHAAAGHASAMLRSMGGLQLALLHGTAGEALQSLSALAGSLPSVPDPGLEAVLQEIAQRAAVELAKPVKPGRE